MNLSKMDLHGQNSWELWAAIIILVASTLPVLIGTILDIFQNCSQIFNHSKANSSERTNYQIITKFLIACSLLTTTKRLFKLTPASSSPDQQFAFINGIRAIGVLIVLVGHTVSLFPLYSLLFKVPPISSYPDVLQNVTGKRLLAQPFFNGVLFVQAFFTISGMLLSYHGLASQQITFVPYVWFRAARYLPPLIGTLCLTMAAEFSLTNGGFISQELLKPYAENCFNGGWWRNLIFISNFSNLNDQCAPHTWYLSTEMQLHIFAFILLLSYHKIGSKLTYFISGFFCTAGIVVTFSIIGLGYSPVILQQIHTYSQYEFQNDFFNRLYLLPYNYFIAYFSGSILGQLLLEGNLSRIIQCNEKVFSALSLASTVVISLWPFATYPLATNDKVIFTENPVLVAFIYTFYHLTWSLATCFLFFRCATQPNWPLARILSAPIFQPLSKLSFSIYLAHYSVIWACVVQSKTVLHLEHAGEFEKLLCLIIAYSLVLAYFVHAVFEVPTANLLKLFIKKMKNNNVIIKKE